MARTHKSDKNRSPSDGELFKAVSPVGTDCHYHAGFCGQCDRSNISACSLSPKPLQPIVAHQMCITFRWIAITREHWKWPFDSINLSALCGANAVKGSRECTSGPFQMTIAKRSMVFCKLHVPPSSHLEPTEIWYAVTKYNLAHLHTQQLHTFYYLHTVEEIVAAGDCYCR